MSHHAPPPITRINILQGQARVSAGPRVEFSTVLGSCVATCLFDPDVQVGGMNHFLLAEPPAGSHNGDFDEHYGVYLMELLINEMLAHGAAKSRMRALLYGGANLNSGFARINIVREDLGGMNARRVDFRPAHGQVRCRSVENTLAPDTKPTTRPLQNRGDVELF